MCPSIQLQGRTFHGVSHLLLQFPESCSLSTNKRFLYFVMLSSLSMFIPFVRFKDNSVHDPNSIGHERLLILRVHVLAGGMESILWREIVGFQILLSQKVEVYRAARGE
ncbi:hypothetical protein IMY05_011G0053700 [Salix suchowensis]|nr:hypothetical protein IMY05_011G0053700 [Salix suchowensis]